MGFKYFPNSHEKCRHRHLGNKQLSSAVGKPWCAKKKHLSWGVDQITEYVREIEYDFQAWRRILNICVVQRNVNLFYAVEMNNKTNGQWVCYNSR